MRNEEKKAQKDEVFRYTLQEKALPENERLYEDKLVELFRRQIINLLDVVELSYQGTPLRIDGFAFLSERHEMYPLYKKRGRTLRGRAE